MRIWMVAAVAVLAAACGGDDDGAGPAPPASTSTSTSVVAEDGRQVDWERGYDVEVEGGWRLVPCEAGPRLMCVKLEGVNQGVVELADFSLDGPLKEALDRGATEREALKAHAEDFHASFVEDRRQGCGPTYELETFGPREATVGRQPGVTYGFEGFLDGRLVERVVAFATISAGRLFIFAPAGVEPGTCMDDKELDDLSLEQLADLEPVLSAIAANSPLPPPAS